MEVWDHGGKLYEINSYYSLPADAWHYELVGLTGARETGPFLAIVIPDATPEANHFTPEPAGHAVVATAGGTTPWPILRRFIDLVESAGDIHDNDQALVTTDDNKLSSPAVWKFEHKSFEVNWFQVSAEDNDISCYELCPVTADAVGTDHVEVQIPKAAGGTFGVRSADRATFIVHGQWDIPWPVFRRFVDLIATAIRGGGPRLSRWR